VVVNEPVSNHPIPIITNAFNQNETIILDSDSDEIVETSIRRYPTDVIVVDSSSDDSDVEILGHSFRPIETFDLNSRDQPSTSTGIRDSIDRPTNRLCINHEIIRMLFVLMYIIVFLFCFE